MSNHVLRCLLKYLKYVIADPDYCANEETVEHAAMLESIYYALSEMNDEPEEEEDEDE